MKKYWIIDLDGFDMAEGTKSARGPFKTIDAAEKRLKEDARELFESYNEPQSLGRNHDWAAPVLIVEEKKKLQQVPVVRFDIKLEAVMTDSYPDHRLPNQPKI